MAPPVSASTLSPEQPFAHPSDDASYDENIRDDQMQNGVRPEGNGGAQYISGGVSDDGMSAIDAEANAYSLRLLFVSGGEYLANIGVTIKDAKGHSVLNATSEGPVLLAKVPPGRYAVVATTDDGSTLTNHVQVKSKHLTSYIMRYPVQD
jgi:hypothetical protein